MSDKNLVLKKYIYSKIEHYNNLLRIQRDSLSREEKEAIIMVLDVLCDIKQICTERNRY